MAWIAGGTFLMGGAGEIAQDSLPIHEVSVGGFWMDRTEVTNAAFGAFVAASGHVTVAERKPKAEDLPGVPKDKLVAGSVCFHQPKQDVPLDEPLAWWRYAEGADWRHPEGPASSIAGKEKHPVVHVAWDDAAAYCRWAGKRLPTEAEWEYASRGGKQGQRFFWGDTQTVGGRWMANVWQGKFPSRNTKDDGFAGSAPVGSFPANGYGLHDMAGNVWEWCADWYRPDYYAASPARDPQGPDSSLDPDEPDVPKRVLRGGSFLCSDSYCYRYTNAARNKGAADTGASHIGFRCVKRGP
jgi:formylglycine-generating enzyme required for sulfatase activity